MKEDIWRAIAAARKAGLCFFLMIICCEGLTWARQIAVPDSIETVDLQSLVEARGGAELLEETVEVCLDNHCGGLDHKYIVVLGSGFRSQPASKPSRPLGNGLQSWISLNGSPLRTWDVFLTLKKDAFEPVYWAKESPWFLTESKRFVIARSGPRFRFLIGDFKVGIGSGAFSGSGWAPITSWTSPTRLHGSPVRFGPNVSNTAFATRRGVAGSLDLGEHLQTGIFGAKTTFTASLASIRDAETDSSRSVITDISGTYAFSTESSLLRRNSLNAVDLGGFLNFESSSLVASILIERLFLESSFKMSLPERQTGVSGFIRKTWRSLEVVGELAVINRSLAFWTSALRVTTSSMGHFKLESIHLTQGASWPFGTQNGFISPQSASTNLYYRARSSSFGIFSLGFGISTTRNERTDNSYQNVDFRAFHEWRPRRDTTVRTIVRRTTREDLRPIPVYDVIGNPIANIRSESSKRDDMPSRTSKTSHFQVNVAQRLSRSLSWKLSPSFTSHPEISASLFLFSFGVDFARTKWKLAAGWVVSSQHGAPDARIQGYYSDSGLSGRFPVSSISGSSSGFSVFFKYGTMDSSIEIRLRETARTDVASDFTYDSRQIQMQIRHTL